MSEQQIARGGTVIFITFVLALVLTVFPLPHWMGIIRPDWIPLVLIYWCLALPSRVNVGIGWLAGFAADIFSGTLLAQHALSYAVIAYISVSLHRQIRLYPLWQQALSVFTLIAMSQLLVAWIRGVTGDAPISWLYWVPSITSGLIWPWLYLVLRDIRRRFRVT